VRNVTSPPVERTVTRSFTVRSSPGPGTGFSPRVTNAADRRNVRTERYVPGTPPFVVAPLPITETDGPTVNALQQTNAANTTGIVRLVSNTGDIGLTDGSVANRGGLVALTATAGAITDADGGATVGIANPGGPMALRAMNGIGAPADPLETQVLPENLLTCCDLLDFVRLPA
jgi:hypothetical protein